MKRFLTIISCAIVFVSCAGTDDIKDAADAANRAASGGSESATGSKAIDLAAQVSQTGDQDRHDVRLDVQRNNSTTASGASYSLASVASGAGAAAAQKAIDGDFLIQSMRAELVALEAIVDTPERPKPIARIDAVRAQLAAAVKELRDAYAHGSPGATVTGNTMIVISPAAIGREMPVPNATDATLAGELPNLLGAILGTKSPATTQPTRPDNE